MEIVTDYTSLYGSTEIPQATGILGGIMVFLGIISFISLAISVVMVIAQWKIFVKNNKPGWYALIPVFNAWTLFEIVGIQGWWILVPFANVVYMYIANYKLPLKMGKSKTLAILNIFFPFVVYPIIAFAKDKNVQVPGMQPQYGQPMMNQAPVQSQYNQPMMNQAPVQPQYNQPMMNQNPVGPQPVEPTVQSQPAARRCVKCNTELAPNVAFCPGCGSKQE